MSETHFRWPGRYAMWRAEGALWLEVAVGSEGARAAHRTQLTPAQGYVFLMTRRRTELLYAIAEGMAAEGAFDAAVLRDLAGRCAEGSEGEIAGLADRWNGAGAVTEVMALLLGGALPGGSCPRWFAPVRRSAGALEAGAAP